MSQLQDQIDAIRKEAYAAGYAAAMQALRDFAARPNSAPAPARRGRPPKSATPQGPTNGRRGRRGRSASGETTTKATTTRQRRRPQRGSNARLIAEVLKGLPQGTGRPADIRRALQADKGVSMAFTSIRHALGQLASRNEAQASDDGKTWRYSGG
jgi:hypothetical protein